jgi:hypothetical protein
MRKFKILVNNKGYYMSNLTYALDYAKRESLVGGRVSVFENDKKLATYERGDLKEWNM